MVLKRRKNKKHKKLQIDNSLLSFSKPNQPFFNSAMALNINLPGLENTLKTVNELSKGLSLAISNKSFLDNYNGALNLQNSIIGQAKTINEELNLRVGQINSISSQMIAPLSVGIAEAGVLAANTKQSFEFGKINESIFKSTELLSDLCINTLQEQQGIILSGLQAVKNIEDLNRLTIEAIPSLSMVSNGLGELMRTMPTFPYESDFPSLKTINEKILITDSELVEYQKKIDDILFKIDPELVNYRRGCWEAFNKKGADYIGQSSGSMRRLVDELLRIIAPDNDVIKTDYFKNNKNAKTDKGHPKRITKIYYVVNYDFNKAEHFKRLAKGFLESYDNLSAWDHNPQKDDDFVHGVFITIEGYLLSLLSEWQKRN